MEDFKMRSLKETSLYAIMLAVALSFCTGDTVHATGRSDRAPRLQRLALDLDTKGWLEDSGTLLLPKGDTRFFLSGLRIIFEPHIGRIRQRGDNHFKVDDFTSEFSGFGFETNLVGSWLSLQMVYIFPFTIELDELSPLVQEDRIITKDRKLAVDYGRSWGFSLIDGLFAFGWGTIYYDKRHIKDPTDSDISDSYFFVNVQAVSTGRALIKRIKKQR